MYLTRIALTMAAGLSLACASAPVAGSDTAASNVVTSEQITASGLPTAYDIVDRLRPRWKRDLTAQGDVSVYVDQRRLGGLDALRDIASQDVRELQYMKGSDAEARWGPDARGGAIIVIRR